MKNFILGIVVTIIAAIIIFGGAYIIWNIGYQKGISSAPSAIPVPAPSTGQSSSSSALSEQPNQAVFNEYFSDVYLMKAPAGATLSPTLVTRANVFNFSAGDKFCVSFDALKAIPASSYAEAIYNTNFKTYAIQRQNGHVALQAGGNMGCEDLLIGPSSYIQAGNYEYKLYINNILATVLPFQVK
jgi:hypothetical protein